MKAGLFLIITFFKTLLTTEEAYKCVPLAKPENGFFINGYCSNSLHSACGLGCRLGYRLIGSSFRECHLDNSTGMTKWSGTQTDCQVVRCKKIESNDIYLNMSCSNEDMTFGTECFFECTEGYSNIGSSFRYCLAIGFWSGTKASCRKIKTEKFVSSTKLAVSTSTTSLYENHFEDLSNWTISFGYSFKKVRLEFHINSLPATSTIWLRTNHTKNKKIIFYTSECFNASIFTNQDSNLILVLSQKFDLVFDLNKIIEKNKWTQVVLRHSDQRFGIFLDGASHLDLTDFSFVNLTTCDIHSSSNNERNEFKISDAFETDEPMRGEITRVKIVDMDQNDETIVSNFFNCFEESPEEKSSFLWSDVFIDRYLSEFKRKPSKFCLGCDEPKPIQHALMYFDGKKNGNVLSYNCTNGYRLVGHPTSVCMPFGSWSHRTPRCRAYKSSDIQPN